MMAQKQKGDVYFKNIIGLKKPYSFHHKLMIMWYK